MARISIYEENDLMRALLREWLNEAGYCDCLSKRGARWAAGRYSGSRDRQYLHAQQKRAWNWCSEIQTAHPGKPLIAISGQFRAGLSAAGATAQALGVQRVIAKPLSQVRIARGGARYDRCTELSVPRTHLMSSSNAALLPSGSIRFKRLRTGILVLGVLVILAFASSSAYDAWRAYD
jgi:hypothetical protein